MAHLSYLKRGDVTRSGERALRCGQRPRRVINARTVKASGLTVPQRCSPAQTRWSN